jgi:hypothetical protein
MDSEVVDWINLVQDRSQWKDVVKSVKKNRAPLKTRKL